jgi:hypothetical protein
MRTDESALSAGGFEDVISHAEAQESPPLAEILLADAQFSGLELEPADPARAVLLAAIAAELKAKTVLRERIDVPRASLLDYVLANPREITVTAADGLFDKLMDVAQGRSLRKENLELFKQVRRLFEV